MSNQDHPANPSRRQFFAAVGVAAGGVALAGITARTALAADAPHVSEKDPLAVSMNYTEDSTKVDAKKFPKHSPDQVCANCQYYQGAATGYGPCQIFSGKSVSAKGWCQVWQKKA